VEKAGRDDLDGSREASRTGPAGPPDPRGGASPRRGPAPQSGALPRTEPCPPSGKGRGSRGAGERPGLDDVIELTVESLAFGGEGIARVDGKVRFIPGALPGERVLAAPVQRRRHYDRMRLVRVIEPSRDRRPPLCPHAAVCGGCALQALDYPAQLAAKAAQVRDCLERIGRISVPEWGPPVPSPLTIAYRNKMEYTFSTRGWHADGPPTMPYPSPVLGLHVPGRFDAVFDLEYCALPSPAGLVALDTVRAFAREHALEAWRSDGDTGLLRHLVVREGTHTGEILLGLVTRHDVPVFSALGPLLAERVPGLVGVVLVVNDTLASVAHGDTERVLHGRPFLRERLSGMEFTLSVQSFFQTNTRGAETLIQVIREGVADRCRPRGEHGASEGQGRPGGHDPGRGHDPVRGDGGRLLDLYCGAGTLGLALADTFSEVLGVEQVASAVANARATAAANGIANARFIEAPVEAWLEGKAPDGVEPPPMPFEGGVLVDPPRSGLHPRAVRGLLALAPPWILYVSCNPSTLARDAALLVDGGYRPVRLRVVDMFPHTAHVESVLLMERMDHSGR
jgi:23S rRNA (uracil1939-C5)-methyltransferase